MSRLDTALQQLGAKHPLGYATKLGTAWLGDSLKLLKRVPDNTVNAIITSPPFALIKKKAYGNADQDEYLDWFIPFCEQYQRVLRKDGSLIIEIGGTWIPGTPTRSLYHFELLMVLVKQLGFHLAQDVFWVNEARIPAPAEWVTVRRLRLKDAVNPIWWLSKTPWPKADNRRVLNRYKAGFEQLIRTKAKRKHLQSLGADDGGGKHSRRTNPSGYTIDDQSFSTNNGGSIPDNLLRCLNGSNASEATDRYFQYCKQRGLEPHPARFPPAIPEFFIKYLTEPGDLVLDPFGGSNTTGELADSLGRRWLSFELSEEYLGASVGRFHPSRLVRRPAGLPRPRFKWQPAPVQRFKLKSR